MNRLCARRMAGILEAVMRSSIKTLTVTLGILACGLLASATMAFNVATDWNNAFCLDGPVNNFTNWAIAGGATKRVSRNNGKCSPGRAPRQPSPGCGRRFSLPRLQPRLRPYWPAPHRPCERAAVLLDPSRRAERICHTPIPPAANRKSSHHPSIPDTNGLLAVVAWHDVHPFQSPQNQLAARLGASPALAHGTPIEAV